MFDMMILGSMATANQTNDEIMLMLSRSLRMRAHSLWKVLLSAYGIENEEKKDQEES
jgi:hypothetical protein